MPPRLTQIDCASAVVRYLISSRDCGVFLVIAKPSPAITVELAYVELTGGSVKNVKSCAGFKLGLALVKKSVMNEPWLSM